MSISSLFPEARRLALRLQSQLEQLEHGNASLQSAVEADVDELNRCVRYLEALALQEGQRKDSWLMRIKGLSDESAALAQALQRYVHRSQRGQRERETRDALFGNYASDRERANMTEVYTREQESLMRSNQMVDDQLSMGRASLQALSDQRKTLKSARRKVLDVANTLGMSSSLLKIIERTDHWNALLTYGCMVLTLVIIGLAYYYFRFLPSQ